ncbi:FAD-binding oxidoreductase [Leucobacter sp. 7(1)]|uniref:FAD-binding oxidoreductase n=1 Tax=Leucobacter sp. 7(1) TaxID=1255613 RepID=UPI00159605CC|nr:FAD-linked oxidase C-terminal domain-containing protein [Leucobacter sp. 7(1)]
MSVSEDPLTKVLAELRTCRAALAARAGITDDPAQLRDESPVAEVARSLLVFPETPEEVAYLVRLAHRFNVPMVPRGGRTGVVGGAVPLEPSLVIDLSRLTEVVTFDVPGRYLRVGAGTTLGRIEELLAPHGMMYPPDPASYRRASIGGTVATNAGGLRCVKYGTTGRWIRTLEIVLADGSIVELGHAVVKDATGYDLRGLMIGSEGTLGIVVSVGITFCPRPANSCLLVAAFSTVEQALEATRSIQDRVVPSMCELLDRGALESRNTSVVVPLLGEVAQWGPDPTLLLVQVDGADTDAESALVRDAVAARSYAIQVVAPSVEAAVLEMRRGGSAVRTGAPSNAVEETLVAPVAGVSTLPQDVSVPLEHVVPIVRSIREISAQFGVESRIAAHAGDGNLHLLLLASEPEPMDGERTLTLLRTAMGQVIDRVLEAGGTVSGEHGIGAAKRRWAKRDLGPEIIGVHRQIKRSLDPHNLLNPHKAF